MRIGVAGPVSLDYLHEHLGVPVGTRGPRGLGGISVNLLIRGLVSAGHEVIAISLDPRLERGAEFVTEAKGLRVCIGPYRRRARDRALDLFGLERDYIRRTVEREKPDVMHAHWTYEFALGALAAPTPTTVAVHDWAPQVLRFYRDAYRVARFAMDAQTFAKAPFLTANSPYIRDKIMRRWGRWVPVVPNAIEPEFLAPEPRARPHGNVLLCVANGFSDLKNQATLMKAFQRVRRRVPDCRLRMIGMDFEAGGTAEQWARSHRVAEGIEFAGATTRERLRNEYDQATVLVHPSLEESFGNALAEAMARRLPVVGGMASGAVPWVLDGGLVGALCDVRSEESIAHAVSEVLCSESLWRRCSQAGFARASQCFGLQQTVTAWLDEYSRVLDRAGGAT